MDDAPLTPSILRSLSLRTSAVLSLSTLLHFRHCTMMLLAAIFLGLRWERRRFREGRRGDDDGLSGVSDDRGLDPSATRERAVSRGGVLFPASRARACVQPPEGLGFSRPFTRTAQERAARANEATEH